jgi:ADP-ribosyl-[dinitrogen reductase] hydrolase
LEIAREFPDGVREFLGGGWLDLAPGEVTDDTQQALILADALTEDGLDLERFASGLVSWYRAGPKDVGNTTRIALDALLSGVSPRDAGAAAVVARGERSSAGNGAVMRCAPVALRFRGDRDRLVSASLESARVTHAEARAAWGAVALNQAITHLLEGRAIAEAAQAAIVGVEDEDVCRAISSAAGKERDQVESTGFVMHTLGAAFWVLARQRSARESIEMAVALGDDADSTGAVTGALVGAAYGATALPESWRGRVQHRERIESEAERLLALSERDSPNPDYSGGAASLR